MSQLMCMMEVLKFNMYIINHTLLSTDKLGKGTWYKGYDS